MVLHVLYDWRHFGELNMKTVLGISGVQVAVRSGRYLNVIHVSVSKEVKLSLCLTN
jgi:hypothetical protein